MVLVQKAETNNEVITTAKDEVITEKELDQT